MKQFMFLLLLFAGFSSGVSAQAFKGNFRNDELKIQVALNLYNDSIPVPGMDDETCYGYLRGNLNGVWIILKVVKIDKNKAVVRAVCDNGSDSQNIELEVGEGKLVMKQVDGANIKTIEGRKYVKLPKTIDIKR